MVTFQSNSSCHSNRSEKQWMSEQIPKLASLRGVVSWYEESLGSLSKSWVRLHLATLAASMSISRQSRPGCVEQEVSNLVPGSLRFTCRPYLGNPVYVYISLSYLILIPWEQFYNSVCCKQQAYKFCPVWYEFYRLPSVPLCHQCRGVKGGEVGTVVLPSTVHFNLPSFVPHKYVLLDVFFGPCSLQDFSSPARD